MLVKVEGERSTIRAVKGIENILFLLFKMENYKIRVEILNIQFNTRRAQVYGAVKTHKSKRYDL